jgi:hypothetical protein
MKTMKKTTQKTIGVFLLAVIAVLFIMSTAWLPVLAFAETAEQLPFSTDLLDVVQQYAVMPVVVFCCIIGAVLKNAFAGFNNKLIPVALIPVGVVCVLWINGWKFTPDTVFAGVCSAVASVGLHATVKHLGEAFKPPEQ